MELVKELKLQGFNMVSTKPIVHCQVFEDNSGALEIAKVPKMCPCTKHINIKYHHFRDSVDRGEISLHVINTNDQPADVLTKPLNEAKLAQHCQFIQGWSRTNNAERECQNTDYGMPNQSQCHSKPNSKKVSFNWSFSSFDDASFLQWCIMTHLTSLPDYYGRVPVEFDHGKLTHLQCSLILHQVYTFTPKISKIFDIITVSRRLM